MQQLPVMQGRFRFRCCGGKHRAIQDGRARELGAGGDGGHALLRLCSRDRSVHGLEGARRCGAVAVWDEGWRVHHHLQLVAAIAEALLRKTRATLRQRRPNRRLW